MSGGVQDSLINKFEDINIKNDTFINILLLGSTGVGKSTFINSIANYLTFDSLDMAKKEDPPMTLICSQFTIWDKDHKQHTVNVGDVDQNEYLQTGESATQDVKSYVFPIWNDNVKVRLIDTPGIGDTRGVEKDDENSENILTYIGQLKKLHAICFLLKPNESRSTVYFKYCMSQILSRLDKSASKNIIFVFTNTKGTDYGPGETVAILKKIVDEIHEKPPYCEIPMNRNVFCFENEPFKYLAACSKQGGNIEFDKAYVKTVETSWNNSSEQCWKLINYIVGDKHQPPLQPHLVQSTSAINEARRMITHLSQPLAEITQLINQNVSLLDRHKQRLDVDKVSVEDLKKNLYMPVANLEVIKLTQPVTVCTSRNCAEVYKVGDKNNWHYKQRCHDPCYLNGVPKEIIGCPELVHCSSMSNKQCIKCACSFSLHMHVYYLTKVKEDRQLDENVQKNIQSREKVMLKVQKLINDIAKKKIELDDEHRTIVNCCAKFAHFLQNNAITPYNDAYKEYIRYLMDREKAMGYLCDMDTVDHLQTLLSEYEETKKAFDDALALNRKLNRDQCIVSAKEIQDSIQKLYALKHNGGKIKELYECQIKSRTKEYENKEYVHKKIKQKQQQMKRNNNNSQQQQQSNRNHHQQQQHQRNRDQSTYQRRANNHRDGGGRNNNTWRPNRNNADPPSYEDSNRYGNSGATSYPPYSGAPAYSGVPPGAANTYIPPLMNTYVPPPPNDHNSQGTTSRTNDLNITISLDRKNSDGSNGNIGSSTSQLSTAPPTGHHHYNTSAHPQHAAGYHPPYPPYPYPYGGYYPPYGAPPAPPMSGPYYGTAAPPYHPPQNYYHQQGGGQHQQHHHDGTQQHQQHGRGNRGGRNNYNNNRGHHHQGQGGNNGGGINRRSIVRNRNPRNQRYNNSGNESDDSQASSAY